MKTQLLESKLETKAARNDATLLNEELERVKKLVPNTQSPITNNQLITDDISTLRERFLEVYRKSIKKGVGDDRVIKMGELFDKALGDILTT